MLQDPVHHASQHLPSDRLILEPRHSRTQPWQHLTLLAGLSLWFPALALEVGGRHVQPAEFVGVLAAMLLLPSLPRLPAWQIAPVLLAYVSWIWTWLLEPDGFRATEVLLYYVGMLGPFLALLALSLTNLSSTRSLLRGLAWGGAVSSAMAVAQWMVGSSQLDPRSNLSFNLPGQARRVFAFFPEASSLSAMLQIMIGVSIANEISRNSLEFPRYLRRPLLIAMVFALVLTRSTSILIVLPLIVVVTVVCSPQRPGRRVKMLATAALTMLVGMAVYYAFFYGIRVDNASGLRSGISRSSTITAALSDVADHPWRGVGLGENAQVQSLAEEQLQSSTFTGISVSTGVNSLTASRMFEEGLFAIAASAWAFMSMVALLRKRVDGVWFVITMFMFGSFAAGSLVSGYRGLLYSWVWYLSPMVLAGWHRDAIARTRVSKNSARRHSNIATP